MKRPEKKTSPKDDGYMNGDKGAFIGWNLACEDYEKWLPSKEEIEEILDTYFKILFKKGSHKYLAKAIANRLEV